MIQDFKFALRRLLKAPGFSISAVIVLALGIGAALTGRLLSELLYEIGPLDPIAFITAPFLLAAVALIATLLPARRATRVDPTVALRTE